LARVAVGGHRSNTGVALPSRKTQKLIKPKKSSKKNVYINEGRGEKIQVLLGKSDIGQPKLSASSIGHQRTRLRRREV